MKTNTPRGLFNKPPVMPIELWRVATHPGSLTILQMPSRVGTTLYYPDGRVVKAEPQ